MTLQKAKTRRKRLLLKRVSFFFKVFAGCAIAFAALAGYARFRIEKLSLAYEISENVRREKRLVEEVAAAEARYDEIFSSRKLAALAAQRGFREPGRSDFIYESETGDGGEKGK